MDHDKMGSDDTRLDALFAAYRDACPDPEASANFMPQLWQKIEAREQTSTVFGRLARNLVTAALALSGILGLAVSLSHSRTTAVPTESYAEALPEKQPRAHQDICEPVT